MAEPWLGTTSEGENRPRPLRALAGRPLRLAALFFASRIQALGLRRIPDSGPAVLLVSGETSAVSLLLTLAAQRRPARFVARLRQSRGRLRSSLVRALGGIPLGVGTDPAVRARNEEGLRTIEHELVGGSLVVLFVGRVGDEGHVGTALEAIRRASGRGSVPVTLPVAVTCDAFRLFRRPAELIVGVPLSPEALSTGPEGGSGGLLRAALAEIADNPLWWRELEVLEGLHAVSEGAPPGDEPAAGPRVGLLARYRRARLERPLAVRRLVAAGGAYLAALEALRPNRGPSAEGGPWRGAALLVADLVLGAAASLAALAGLVVHLAPRACGLAASKALRSGEGPSAWVFLLASLVLVPPCYALLAWALFSWGGISAALAALASAPMAGLWLVEAPGFLRRRLRACLFLARCPARGAGASALSALRSEVDRALAALPDFYRE